MKRLFGFTLAEVLITLTIIGIVAALTIPTLVTNYQKRQYVVQLQKVYSSLANAAKMLMADEQVDNLNNTYLREPDEYDWDTQGKKKEMYENSAGRFLKTYFKVTKVCPYTDYNTSSECVGETYKQIDGSDDNVVIPSGYCVQISSGATICLSYPFTNSFPAQFHIDVNGPKGPNVWGRDAFYITLNYRGELAEGFSERNYYEETYCTDVNEFSSGYSSGCLSKIIRDGWKMDY